MWLVRHGQSAGNVANDHAIATGLHAIDLTYRDVDVALSPLGVRQATALGQWFRRQPAAYGPTVVLTSPYRRAMSTAELIAAELEAARRPTLVFDERLREKELGSLNRLTRAGILSKFPAEAVLRDQIGKFYYRPPGGESWCDVLLRLRSLVDSVRLQYAGERVLVVSHQVLILCFRYLLENLTEQQILEIDRTGDVANCSLTTYACNVDEQGRGTLSLQGYNDVTALAELGEVVTDAPDRAVVPR
jgi:probable phosphoglycerate mutase